MAKAAIGVGTSANDGTGDDLRSGAIKINNSLTKSIMNWVMALHK